MSEVTIFDATSSVFGVTKQYRYYIIMIIIVIYLFSAVKHWSTKNYLFISSLVYLVLGKIVVMSAAEDYSGKQPTQVKSSA